MLFAAHLLFGAARLEFALGLAAAEGLILAILVAACPWARREIGRAASALRWPGLLLLAVAAVGLLSLTPFAPGGPHPMWAFVNAAAASAVDKSAVEVELVRLAALACLFLVAWCVGSEDERARWFLRLFVIATGLFAIWAFTSHLADPGVLFGSIPLPYSGTRLSAAFLSANTAGTFFGASILISASALTDRLRGLGRGESLWSGRVLQRAAPSLVALVFCAACLILTASRGAFVATGIALTGFLLWEAAARRWRMFGIPGLGVVALMAILAALITIGGAPLLERLMSVDPGASGRGPINTAHWQAFLAAPWMGYGLGSFEAVNRMVTTAANYPQLWNIHAAHNVYLQWLEEAGVIGAAPMFACVGLILWSTVRGAGRRLGMTTWIRGLVSASLVPLIHGVSDYGLQVPSIAALSACLLGLVAGLAMRPPSGQAVDQTAASGPLAWAAGIAGLATAIVAAIYSAQAATAGGAAPFNVLPSPATYDAMAARALERDPAKAKALSRKALKIRPLDARAWLNLAMIDERRGGHLSRAGLGYLQRTYDTAPYDPALIADRLALAYDNWSLLPADMREETNSETLVAWRYRNRNKQMFTTVQHTRTQAGRMALAMELFRLRVRRVCGREPAKGPRLSFLIRP